MENKGPISLSLMVTMAESYLQHLEDQVIHDALKQQPSIDLKTHRRYVYDSHTRFRMLMDATRFLIELNKQNEQVQYTIEVENEDKGLASMNVKSTNNRHGSHEFRVYRKKAITNLQVNP